jgi:hypothetical protein
VDFINDLKMPVLRDEALLREIQEEMRRGSTMSATPTNQTNNRNTSPVSAPELVLPTLNLDLLEDNPPPPSEDDSDGEDSFVVDMEDELEAPSYNPLLD